MEYNDKYWEDRKFEMKHIQEAIQWNIHFKPKRVFIHGCGMGYRVNCFISLGVDAWGMDISEYAIKNAFGYARGRIFNEIPNGEFDLIISYDVLEHMTDEQIDKALKKLYEISTKHVLFAITSKDNPNFVRDPTHINGKTMKEWTDVIESFGWEIKETPKWFMYYPMMIVGEKV